MRDNGTLIMMVDVEPRMVGITKEMMDRAGAEIFHRKRSRQVAVIITCFMISAYAFILAGLGL